jgi:hypothetical protein
MRHLSLARLLPAGRVEADRASPKSLFTAQELTEMRDKPAAALNDWHSANKPQNVPEYRRLSDTYFLVAQQLKNFK